MCLRVTCLARGFRLEVSEFVSHQSERTAGQHWRFRLTAPAADVPVVHTSTCSSPHAPPAVLPSMSRAVQQNPCLVLQEATLEEAQEALQGDHLKTTRLIDL